MAQRKQASHLVLKPIKLMLAASRHMGALVAVPMIALLAIRCMHKYIGFKDLLYLGFRDLLYSCSIESVHAEQVFLPWLHHQICHR
jgi:hypothetical protein